MRARVWIARIAAIVGLLPALSDRGSAAPAAVRCDAETRRVIVRSNPWPGSVTVEADYPDPCWELVSATVTWQSRNEATAEFVVRDVHGVTPDCPTAIVTYSAEAPFDPEGCGCSTMTVHETVLEADGSIRSQASCSVGFYYCTFIIEFPDLSEWSAVSAGGTVMACPAKDGPSLAERGASVILTLRHCGEPVVGFPAQDVWLKSKTHGAVVLCQGGLVGDNNSGTDGVITISGRIAGGGWEANAMQAVVAGWVLVGPGMDIHVNSPDITGDLRVDLADAALFSADLAAQSGFRSDFYANGVVNLADVGIFSAHLGHTCQ